jgi:DeoR/GlpR family transcriptional regulator of sugar metabolism
VDHAFISAKGVLIPDGLMDSDLDEVEVKRAFIAAAAKTTALLDSSKFGKRALGTICDLSALHLLVTDVHLSAEYQSSLVAHGLNIYLVNEDT